MRIDDKNKVVWMNDCTPDDLMLKLRKYNFISKIVELSKFSGKHEIPFNVNDEAWSDITFAVFNGYEFKIEQPKKYYWRKKKEYLAWFEDVEGAYFNYRIDGKAMFADKYSQHSYNGYKTEFTETEARDLLKDDFDKFEKVECEE